MKKIILKSLMSHEIIPFVNNILEQKIILSGFINAGNAGYDKKTRTPFSGAKCRFYVFVKMLTKYFGSSLDR